MLPVVQVDKVALYLQNFDVDGFNCGPWNVFFAEGVISFLSQDGTAQLFPAFFTDFARGAGVLDSKTAKKAKANAALIASRRVSYASLVPTAAELDARVGRGVLRS